MTHHRSSSSPEGSLSDSAPGQPAPVKPGERIETLDMLRGFALLLIPIANVVVFSGCIYMSSEQAQELWTASADRVVEFLRLVFVENKGLSLFSLLFGVGFGLQLRRARKRGTDLIPRYLRRLSILLVIGLAHSFLLWGGDILVPYAVLGFVLTLFYRASDRAILGWAIGVYLLPIPLYGAMMLLGMPEPYSVASGLVGDPALFSKWMQGFSSGGLLGVIQGNAAFLVMWWAMFAVNLFWPDVLGLFLLGLYIGRWRLFRRIEHEGERPPFLQPKWIWGAGLVGVAGNVAFAVFSLQGVYYPPSWLGWLQTTVQYLTTPFLLFFFVGGMALLFQRPAWQKRLRVLAAVGRMSLTNYILQSLLFVLIFYDVGFGLFMQVGYAVAVGIGGAVYLLQIGFSRWWVARFRYGPVEWLWRRLTYGTPIPLRPAASGTASAPGQR